jgi:hypothetical protein
MSHLRASLHTMILAIVAAGMAAGILSWATEAIVGFKPDEPRRHAPNILGAVALPPSRAETKIAASADLAKPNSAGTGLFAPHLPTAIQPGGTQFDISGWENDLDWLRKGSVLPTVNLGAVWQGTPPESSDVAAADVPSAPVSVAASAAPQPPSAPDAMASSAGPSSAAPSSAPSGIPAAPGAVAYALAPQMPRPPDAVANSVVPMQSIEHAGRHQKAEPAHAVASKPPKLALRRFYLEKSVEQGDSGEIKFRYQHRACAPPNIVDVCFMPAKDRARIVVERW